MDFGPAKRAHLKKRPCAIYMRWWDVSINTEVYVDALRGHKARVLRYRGCTHLTATSSGRFNNLFLGSFLRAMRGLLLRNRSISGCH